MTKTNRPTSSSQHPLIKEYELKAPRWDNRESAITTLQNIPFFNAGILTDNTSIKTRTIINTYTCINEMVSYLNKIDLKKTTATEKIELEAIKKKIYQKIATYILDLYIRKYESEFQTTYFDHLTATNLEMWKYKFTEKIGSIFDILPTNSEFLNSFCQSISDSYIDNLGSQQQYLTKYFYQHLLKKLHSEEKKINHLLLGILPQNYNITMA